MKHSEGALRWVRPMSDFNWNEHDQGEHRIDELEHEHPSGAQSAKRQFWCRALKLLLFVHDFDPHAVYKLPAATPTQSGAPPKGPLSWVRPRFSGHTASVRNRTHPMSTRQSELASGRWLASLSAERSADRRAFYRAPQLRKPTSPGDARRHRRTRPVRLFLWYYLIKSLLVVCGHLARLKHDHLVPKGYREPWISVEWTELLARLLGNPIQVLKDVAVVFYVFPVGMCFITLVVLPVRYARQPLNLAPLRFLLDPLHELKRIDLGVAKRVRLLRASLLVYWAQRRLQLGRKLQSRRRSATSGGLVGLGPAGASPSQAGRLERLAHSEQLYCRLLAAHLDHLATPSARPALRPANYSAAYHLQLRRRMTPVIGVACLYYAVCNSVLFYLLAMPAIEHQCHAQRQLAAPEAVRTESLRASCSLTNVFTAADLLMLAEIMLVLVLCALVSALNLTLFSLATNNHHKLIRSMRHEMGACRELLVRLGQVRARAAHARGRCPSEGAPEAGSGARLAERVELDKALVETLIRLMLFDLELRDSARGISELAHHPIYYATSAILLATLGGVFKFDETAAVRKFVLVATWINFNAVACSCAHAFARILDFERLMWFTLAANASLEAPTPTAPPTAPPTPAPNWGRALEFSGSRLSDVELRHCSFVADLWVKFVFTNTATIERYCVRSLHLKLTYQTIVELNFFAIFAYSIFSSVA